MLESILFWNIIDILATIVEWLVFRFILKLFGKPKNNKTKENITFTLSIIIVVILTMFDINPNMKLFMVILSGYLFAVYNYDINVWKVIVISLAYWMMLIGIDAVGAGILLLVNDLKSINDLLKGSIYRIQLIIITKFILVSIIPIIKGIKTKIELTKNDFINIIIPIIANILSIVGIFGLVMNEEDLNYGKHLIIIIVSGILLLSNLSLVNIIGKIIKGNNIQLENKIIKEKVDMQYSYYLTLQQNQLKVRKLYHDMSNHINCIQTIYENNGDVIPYTNSIKNELHRFNSVFYTGNMILDIILNDNKSKCDKNNIKFDVNINFSKCEFIEMIDVCSIFSNILDNAIEACHKINDNEINRYISIKGNIVEKFFILKCENSKINEVKINNKGELKTNKKDDFLHGIGINSIKNSLEKYDGGMSIKCSSDKFIVDIYIPLTQ